MKSKFFSLITFFALVLILVVSQPISANAQCDPQAGNCAGTGSQTGNQNGVGSQTGSGNGTGSQTGNQNGSGSQTGNQNGGSGNVVRLNNPITAQNIQQLIAAILQLVVKVGAPIILFFIIYVGFLFATARGNVAKLETAKRALIWTLIGGLIILGAQVLSSIIQSTIDQIWHG